MSKRRTALQAVVRQVDVERRILTILGTTPAKDRYRDIVEPRGGDLKAFRANPVFLWAHDYSQPPIGKSVKETVTDQGIEFTIQFATTEFANEIFQLYRDGFLKAASIGFVPLEWENLGDGGYRYTKWELLELSAVPVPANPEALALAVKRGLSQDLISRVFESEAKGVISYGQAHPDGTPKAPEDTEWDGPAEIAAASVDDLKIMCAWVDSENADNKGAYKLPHHKAAGEHAVVWKGVAAAMAALLGARGGVDVPEEDRKGIYNHLAKHYQEFEKEPPEFKDAAARANDGDMAEMVDQCLELMDKCQKIMESMRDMMKGKAAQPIGKAGAVLAKRNKDRLVQAKTLIDEVLADAEGEPAQDSTPEPATRAAEPAASSLPATPAVTNASNPPKPVIDPDAIASYAAQVAQAELRRMMGKVN